MKRKLFLCGILAILLFQTLVLAQSTYSGQDSYKPPSGVYTSLEELKDKRVGIVTGTSFDQVTTEQFPDAEVEYFNNTTDLITALIVTHEMGFARAICNRVFYMDGGGICEDGTPEQIFDHPRHENTRRFVRKLKVLELDISNKYYDFLGMAARITEYCRKNQTSPKLETWTHRVFEELIDQILLRTLDRTHIHTVMEYSKEEEKMTMYVRFSGPEPKGILDSGELSVMLLNSAIAAAEFSREEEDQELPNRIVIHLRRP